MFADPVPLTPDPDLARQWLQDELSKAAYAEATPTWFDTLAGRVSRFISGIFGMSAGEGGGTVLLIVICVIIVAGVIVAVLIWGNPRLRRTSEVDATALFDADDERTALELRAASEAAAAAGDLTAAIVLRMRALARALRERGAVSVGPGATVHAFATQAAAAFPAETSRLHAAAADFDDVRYLRRPGTAEMFAQLRDLDATLAHARPAALAELP